MLAVLITSLLLALASAQNGTLTFLLPGTSGYTPAYAGSVITACPDSTVLAMVCTLSEGGLQGATCGTGAPVRSPIFPVSFRCSTNTMMQTLTYTIGSSSFNVQTATQTGGGTGVVDVSCAFTGTTTGTCVESLSASADDQTFTTGITTTLSAAEITAQPVAITAGSEKLNATGKCSSGANGKAVAGVGIAALAALFAVAMM